jgi:hypothetical protein
MESDNKHSRNEKENLDKLRQERKNMLDLQKGAKEMDSLNNPVGKIEGKTVSGAGGGPGTGALEEENRRPGTEGKPPQNDFVDPEVYKNMVSGRMDDDMSAEIDADRPNMSMTGELDEEGNYRGDDHPSGYPGGGAARSAEDKIPPAKSDKFTGYTPGKRTRDEE